MDLSLSVDAKGALAVLDRLQNPKARKRVMTNAKWAAATVVRKTAAASKHFKDTDGTVKNRPGGVLRRQLNKAKISQKRTRINKNVFVVAGMTMHWGTGEDAYYARFVEFGHLGPRKSPKATKGRHFMLHAANDSKQAAYKAFAERFIKGVNDEVDKVRSHYKPVV